MLPVLFIGWCTRRDGLLEAHFNTIKPGMSPDDVTRIMGKPSWVGRCGAKMPTGLPAQCTREFGYAETLAPILPRYYLIWLGRDSLVVETAPITSP
jgi:hypothetical protein